MKILCVGMMVCDIIISPVPGNILMLDSATIDKPKTTCGGDALNVAIGLARLGCEVSIVGRIAGDKNGSFIQRACKEAGVGTEGIIIDDTCATATTFALVDSHGERHFLTNKEIFSKLKSQDVSQNLLEWADIVYFGSAMAMKGMNEGGLEDLFLRAKSLGKITIMDAALDDKDTEENWLNKLAPVLLYTDIFFPSLNEAVAITGKNKPSEISKCFSKFGMKALGIKLGADGCYVTDFNDEKYIPGLQDMPVVDTTGAGDSFLAGLICAIDHGWDIFQGAEFANTVAARNVGAHGGTAGIPDFNSALAFYNSAVEQK